MAGRAARTRGNVWLRGDQPARRPRLTLERIVAAAVELLDVEGVEGLTMRRLAARLDAGTMSLYEYVAAKEDLLDHALDAVLGEIDPVDSADSADAAGEPAAGWRAVLADLASQSRDVMRRHPWVPSLVGTRPLLGPRSLARSERAYAALHSAGCTGPALVAAISALFSYVHGFVAAENAWRAAVAGPGEDADLRARAAAHLAERLERYPTLAAHARLDLDDFDEGFALGLDIVLDGIAARVGGDGPRGETSAT